MSMPSNHREQGPYRSAERKAFREHPKADNSPFSSSQRASFETDVSLNIIDGSLRLERDGSGYMYQSTANSFRTYQGGWDAHKAHMNQRIDLVLRAATDPDERELLQRAFTKLRMAL